MNIVIGFDPSLTSAGICRGKDARLIKTSPQDETMMEGLRRRVEAIGKKVWDFVTEEYNPLRHDLYFVVEAPSLNAGASNHLMEVGYLTRHIEDVVCKFGHVHFLYVPPSSLKKWACGDGSAPKKHTKDCGTVKHLKKGDKTIKCIKCSVKEKFGVEFEKDPGQDKLIAYMLTQYGEAVANGTVKHNEPLRRGKGKK